MEIKDFKDLTSFILNTYEDISLTLGVKKPSNHFIDFCEDTLQKYSELYDKPLFFIEKQKVKLLILEQKEVYKMRKAMATMPHGKLWKFFHPTLWKKICALQEQKENDNLTVQQDVQTSNEVLVPAIIHRRDPEPISSNEDI